MQRELISKIKELKQIQPSQKWLDSTRYSLASQIVFEEDVKPSNFWSCFKGFQLDALVVCLFVIFIGGPWLAIKAAESSLPGELLYSVKKATEGIQTTVVSENDRSQLHVEFAGRRLDELTKIADESFTPLDSEAETEKVEQFKKVITCFKDNLAEVSVYAGGISKEQAIDIAKKAKRMREDLDKTKEELPEEVQTDLAEAEKAIEEINYQILTTLIGEDEEIVSSSDTASTTDEEILIFIEGTDTDKIVTSTGEVIEIQKEEDNEEE